MESLWNLILVLVTEQHESLLLTELDILPEADDSRLLSMHI